MTKSEMLKAAFEKRSELVTSAVGGSPSFGLGDIVRGVFGYHDLNEVSRKTGIPKKDVATYYHGLRVPNKSLYSTDNVSRDISKIFKQREKYNQIRVQSGLFNTQPGSRDEADVMKAYGPKMDSALKSVLQTQTGLARKYVKIKNE